MRRTESGSEQIQALLLVFGRAVAGLCAVVLLAGPLAPAARAQVQLTDDRLIRDGVAAPYLFGAEVQYFRARGGPGRNVSRAEVERLWDLMLDRLQQAHMNTVSFYIPWDFHEPVEGTFDFDGTLDRDGDGKADYPSRDVRGFLRKVAERGFKYVIVRPGPYINAEWGPVGFGAVPLWFLQNYPEALATTRTPGGKPVATYAHPVYREHVKRWFTALYQQVLADYIGPGKPIVLMQLDNETNYFWDSVYQRDFSPTGQERYHDFLSQTYGGDIARLNSTYGSAFPTFSAVSPPTGTNDQQLPGFSWQYDWYNWHDAEIHDYFTFLRETWEGLGVKQPDVLFSRCDSFNAFGGGLLPRLDFGQDGGLAMSTLNIYPKTGGTQAQSTLNTPMKAAHDATLLASSHRQYYGTAGDWVMSTETVGGWFPNQAEVSLATREHTYASLLGSGVKAMIIYYFNEGYNWDGLEKQDTELHFDAPLDKDMQPQPAFALLQSFGKVLADGLGDKLVAASPVRSPVLLAHDSWAQYPAPGRVNALQVASTDSAAMYGLFRAAGTLPAVAFLDRMGAAELAGYRLVVWQHPGYIGAQSLAKLQAYVDQGGALVVVGDNAGDVAVVVAPGGAGRVTRLATSPAAGWNDDGFLALGSAATRDLAVATDLIAKAGLVPSVVVSAGGSEPYVHAWVSRAKADGRLFLFVENFLRTAQTINVKLAPELLGALRTVNVSPALLAGGGMGKATVMAGGVSAGGVELPVSADGVDIWEIGPSR